MVLQEEYDGDASSVNMVDVRKAVAKVVLSATHCIFLQFCKLTDDEFS